MGKTELVRDNYENHTRKLVRSLKLYFMPSYKHLIFDILPEVRKKEGTYHFKLDVDKKTEAVYGSLEFDLLYKDGVITMLNNTYENLLYVGYTRVLKTYKGIVYRDDKDLFKIKLLETMEAFNENVSY